MQKDFYDLIPLESRPRPVVEPPIVPLLDLVVEAPVGRRSSRRPREEQLELTAAEKRAHRFLQREIRFQQTLEDSFKPREKRVKSMYVFEDEESEPESAYSVHDSTEDEKDIWHFKCLCGLSGKNVDGNSIHVDGSPSIACGTCNVWQHISCVSANLKEQPDWSNFDFICSTCKPSTFLTTALPPSAIKGASPSSTLNGSSTGALPISLNQGAETNSGEDATAGHGF